MTPPDRRSISTVLFLQGVLAASFFAAAGLLVLAGLVKLRRPEPTARALSAIGLPQHHVLARLLGLAEVAVGVGAIVSPPALAPGVALFYAAFAVFVAYALVRGVPLESCGCLGETDTEPSGAHVAVTALAAISAASAAVWPLPALDAIVSADPLEGALLATAIATAVYLIYLTLVFLPDAFSAYRRPVRDLEG